MGPDRVYERLVEGKHMDQAFTERVAGHLTTIGLIISESVRTLARARAGVFIIRSVHRGSK
jgi:hypothetical protein